MIGRCTCCGGKKYGAGRGLCLACARAGAKPDLPKSCEWCADRQQEADLIKNLKKGAEAPLVGRNSLLLGEGSSR